METNVEPIPKGYHSLTPYLIVNDAKKAIQFYEKVFGAKELYRMDAPNGKIGHCEIEIGDSRFMLADEFPERGAVAPTQGGRAFSLVLYVPNVDEIFDEAIDNGGVIVHPVKDQFYGDRMGTFRDPFGHEWSVGTHVEDVSPEEMDKRSKEMFS
ncbi:VOC family protein [Peredibacter starrii]|uniref:VOC family protein n=1 Tax=Peredibacter starrii TaxID=28202 RepID=A0AAX4HJ07_9BACT|nr:VOC family protein [Peredibacter starrii]WPU63216.1 VOC family protein [Peredibacter starrii]